MGNHAFNITVVLFWLATMSWLVVAKVLPPLRVGEPPNYASILKESDVQLPVCWSIRLHDRPIGWAATKITKRNDGISDMFSRVYLDELPLDELVPGWISTVLKPMLSELGDMDIDKRTRLVVDPLGRLVNFESRVRVGDFADAIKVQGQIEGAYLRLTVQSGELISYKDDQYLSPDALLTDELSPQTRMPGLRVGQKWTVPLYSPFHPQNSPMEILQAVVDREDRITWGGSTVGCRVIIYRSDSGSPHAPNDVRGKIWVRHDGTVLRQEVNIFKSRLQFVRIPDDGAQDLCDALADDWAGSLSKEVAKGLLEQLRKETHLADPVEDR